MAHSAVAHVFQTYELLHHILAFLSPKDLYSCVQVNSSIYYTFRGSKQLQAKMPINTWGTQIIMYAARQCLLERLEKDGPEQLSPQSSNYIQHPQDQAALRAKLTERTTKLCPDTTIDLSADASWRNIQLIGRNSGSKSAWIAMYWETSFGIPIYDSQEFAVGTTLGQVFDRLKQDELSTGLTPLALQSLTIRASFAADSNKPRWYARQDAKPVSSDITRVVKQSKW